MTKRTVLFAQRACSSAFRTAIEAANSPVYFLTNASLYCTGSLPGLQPPRRPQSWYLVLTSPRRGSFAITAYTEFGHSRTAPGGEGFC